MRRKDVMAYGALTLIWGVSFIVLLRVVQAFGWVGAVTFRCLLAGSILLVFAGATRRKLRFTAGWKSFAAVGATTVAGQLIGMSYATPRIGTAMAAIFVATIPLFSMLIGHVWGLERVTAQGAFGLLLGLGGVVLLVGFPAVPITATFVLGCCGSIVAAVSAAFGSNYASRHLAGVGPWEVTIGSFLCGGMMSLPLLLAVPVPAVPRLIDLGYLLILSGVMSAVAYVLYFRLVADIGATKTISVEFAVTAAAVLVGAVFLREPLSVAQLVGGSVIVLGCASVLGLLPWRARTAHASLSGTRTSANPSPVLRSSEALAVMGLAGAGDEEMTSHVRQVIDD